MKIFIKLSVLALTMALLSSCGLQDQVNELRSKSNQSENRVAALRSRVNDIDTYMQLTLSNVIKQISSLAATSLDNNVLTVQQVDSIMVQITALQLHAHDLTIQLAVLQGYIGIVGIKDPCGQQPGFNQVLLKLSDGRYLSSYSDNAAGDNTRFIVLTDGTYRTTDGTRCVYTVSNYGTVISNERN